MLRKIIFLWSMCVLLAANASGQTTEFTYQGRLLDGSLPPTANYDLEFRLFSAETGGTLLGSESRPAVAVSNGVFTVRLDFGGIPEAFDGAERWLEIAVRPAGGPAFTTLDPRQPISSAPYSIRSLNAQSANTAANAAQLGGVAADQYVITTDPRMTDSRTPTAGSADYIQNNPLSQQPSSNFNISGTGLIGGNLGVGTATPGAKLDVSGNGIVRARVNSDSNAGFAINLNNQPGWSVATTTGGQFQIFNDALVANAVWIDPANNNVGIGTITPGAKLDVAGGINALTQYNLGGSRILSNPGSLNLFAGLNTGVSNGSGAANTFVGDAAGRSNVGGNGNSYFGRAAGENSTGSSNSFVGVVAGQFATGTQNAFFGAGSGQASAANSNTASGNSFFGYQSGAVNTSGNLNAFFGSGSGRANTTGIFNAFFGATSGFANVGGSGNSFFGMGSGDSNIGGFDNSFVGRLAGNANTDGSLNVFVGVAAGQSNTTGNYNTIVGGAANVLVDNLSFAAAIGARSSVGTSDTIVLGKVAGTYDGVPRPADTVQIPGTLSVTGAINGTVLNATNATTAQNAVNLGGVAANQFVQTSDPRLSDARDPLPGSTNYIQNNPGSQQGSSSFNISGNGTIGGIADALNGYRINGTNALRMSGVGGRNTFVGSTGQGGDHNSFLGNQAGAANTGFQNSFFGSLNGTSNTSGSLNSFFGTQAGQSNITGDGNSFFGYAAGVLNQTGSNNSFFGRGTGSSNTIGQLNAFFGNGAGGSNTNGSSNTFVGVGAGQSNVGGSNNTMLGFNANVLSGGLTFATAIGAGATINRSNQIVLGRSGGLDEVVIPGPTLISNSLSASSLTTSVVSTQQLLATLNAGIGTTTPSFKLHVIDESNTGLRVQTDVAGGTVASFGGNGAFQIDRPGIAGGRFTVLENGRVGIGTNNPTNNLLEVTGTVAFNLASGGATNVCQNFNSQISTCSSSIRYKQDIHSFSSGLDLINRLRPVTFNWKADNKEDMGLVAEEVAEAEPLLVTHNDKGEVEGVKYDRIGVVAVNAIKEQQAEIKSLEEKIRSQDNTISEQKIQIDAIKKALCEMIPASKLCKP